MDHVVYADSLRLMVGNGIVSWQKKKKLGPLLSSSDAKTTASGKTPRAKYVITPKKGFSEEEDNESSDYFEDSGSELNLPPPSPPKFSSSAPVQLEDVKEDSSVERIQTQWLRAVEGELGLTLSMEETDLLRGVWHWRPLLLTFF